MAMYESFPQSQPPPQTQRPLSPRHPALGHQAAGNPQAAKSLDLPQAIQNGLRWIALAILVGPILWHIAQLITHKLEAISARQEIRAATDEMLQTLREMDRAKRP